MTQLKEHVLLGKTITEILIAEDKQALLFKTPDGDIKVRCDGDCCSTTWVETIELPAGGFPASVISVDDLDFIKSEQHPEHDYLQYYGFKISTDKGDIVIDYRNSSNGYYGGNLVWPQAGDDYHYGGVYGQNVSHEVWKPVVSE